MSIKYNTGDPQQAPYQIIRDRHIHRLIGKAKHLDDLSHTVRAIIEEEQGIAL
jgi:hypothetical protein